MGQVSLIRLEKLDTAMKLESNLLYDFERWAGLKMHCFTYLFMRQLINKKHFLFNYFWYINSRSKITSNFKNINKKNRVWQKNNLSAPATTETVLLNNYIYQQNNKYISLLIYSNHNNAINTLHKLKKVMW